MGAVNWYRTWYKSPFITGLSNGGKCDLLCVVGALFNIQRHCSLGHNNESIHYMQHLVLICIESVVGSCNLTLWQFVGLSDGCGCCKDPNYSTCFTFSNELYFYQC